MKLALATDAWFPQVNGVVRSLSTTVEELARRGQHVELITPQDFRTAPMPGYSEIRLAMMPRFRLRKKLDAFQPDMVHIATEGPIGWSARRWCLSNGIPHTTSYHTRFPEYASVRTGLSADCFWPVMRRFHSTSRAVLVSTPSLGAELTEKGIPNVTRWSRGIDHTLFRPDGERHPAMTGIEGPILLYVGRVAIEKNLEAFLSLDTPGTKVIVGDGPARETLGKRYPDTRFLGALSGETLASAYRSADCFVFPSLTDTFGLVVIEALASGVPVAAYPVTGPIDIIGKDGLGLDGDLASPAGALDDDLGQAVTAALAMDRNAAAELGARYSWERATDQFIGALTRAYASARAETLANAA